MKNSYEQNQMGIMNVLSKIISSEQPSEGILYRIVSITYNIHYLNTGLRNFNTIFK